jgi:hypothetical protein
MASHELSLFTGEHILESSESESETQNRLNSQGKTKQAEKSFMGWTFHDTIQADVSDVSTDARKALLMEHIRNRTAHDRPRSVQSVTIIADLTEFFAARPRETPAVSIAIVGYVQTKKSRKFTMTNWLRDATWNPVPGGLCSNSEFLADMKRADDPSMPGWCQLPIFGELGLNNQGRNAARNARKVFAHFQLVSRSISCAVLTLLCVLPAEDGRSGHSR